MIIPFKTSIDPLCIPHSEQYNLFVLAKIENGKVQAMKMDTSKESIKKVEAVQLPKLNPDLDNIAKIICDYFRITIEELSGPSQKGTIMQARKIFCAIARRKTRRSLSKIGEFVNRDHCTVLGACRSIDELRMKINIKSGMSIHYNKIIQRFE